MIIEGDDDWIFIAIHYVYIFWYILREETLPYHII